MEKLTMEMVKNLIIQINSYKMISRTLNNPANKDVAVSWTTKLDEIAQRKKISEDDELLYSYINVQYLLIQIQEQSAKQYASAFGSMLDLHTTILKKELAECDNGDKKDKKDKEDNSKVQGAGLDTNISDKMKNIITSMDNFN